MFFFEQDGAPPNFHHNVTISEELFGRKMDWQRWTTSVVSWIPINNSVTYLWERYVKQNVYYTTTTQFTFKVPVNHLACIYLPGFGMRLSFLCM
jgi:hypothetical protein